MRNEMNFCLDLSREERARRSHPRLWCASLLLLALARTRPGWIGGSSSYSLSARLAPDRSIECMTTQLTPNTSPNARTRFKTHRRLDDKRGEAMRRAILSAAVIACVAAPAAAQIVREPIDGCCWKSPVAPALAAVGMGSNEPCP
jgi:hypothetical protein